MAGYGLVIVDEAHRVGAPTVEKALRRIPARRWAGLTATAYRRDGLGPVIVMHCGPKRYTIPLVDKTDPQPLRRAVYAHQTTFTLPDQADTTKPGQSPRWCSAGWSPTTPAATRCAATCTPPSAGAATAWS